MQWNSDDVRLATRIFIHLLKEGQIVDRELYHAYNQGDVRLILEEIVEKEADVKIFSARDSLYITPGVDNRYFGYTNAELRSKMKLKDNSQLYLAYFSILCLLAKFYNSDDQSLTSRQFVPLEELEQTVTAHVKEVVEAQEQRPDDVKAFSGESYLNLPAVASAWQDLPAFDDTKKSLRRARNNRISFLLHVFGFLEQEGLVQVLEDREVRLLPKIEHLIIKYYFHSERKDKLLTLLADPIIIPEASGVASTDGEED